MLPKRTLFLLFSLVVLTQAINWQGDLSQSAMDDLLHWGTYKSHRIHSITEKTEPFDSLTLSMMVGNDLSKKHYHNILYNFEDIQDFYNQKTKLYYKWHNGFTYANQYLDDPISKVNLTNTFYKTYATAQRQAWGTLTNVYPYQSSQEDVTLFFGIALESYHNNGTRYLEFDAQKNQIKVNRPNSASEITGDVPASYINLHFYQNGLPVTNPKGIEVHYQAYANMNQSKLWNLSSIANDSLIYNQAKDYLILPNTVDKDTQHTYLVLFQFKIRAADGYSILFTYDTNGPVSTPDFGTLKRAFSTHEAAFTTQMTVSYPGIPSAYKAVTQYAISNLLGGILYYYGPITIQEDPKPQPALPLFTATPTRNFYERGFLWDEGFHQLLICRWSPYLCTKIMASWLGTQYPTGWIAREQVRTDELKIFVNESFIPQSNVEGNPPTLMLAFEYLTSNSAIDPAIKTQIYTELKDKMYKWWEWFYNYQMAKGTKDMFIWTWKEYEGRIDFYGSGLDDYPRSDPGFISKYHLDLHVWEMMFAQIMGNISTRAGDKGNATFFANKFNDLKANLDKFIDTSDHVYKDIFKPNSTTNNTDLPSPHIGYISLLPLVFGYMKEGSREMDATLDLIDEGGVMYTRFGMTSLSQKDSAFEQYENYWTGPLWLNFHYMTLRALKLFYWNNPRSQKIYTKIRGAIINTVNESYLKTGYIWEIYDLRTGEGMRSHIFTGWSALVTMIITEQYQ